MRLCYVAIGLAVAISLVGCGGTTPTPQGNWTETQVVGYDICFYPNADTTYPAWHPQFEPMENAVCGMVAGSWCPGNCTQAYFFWDPDSLTWVRGDRADKPDWERRYRDFLLREWGGGQ